MLNKQAQMEYIISLLKENEISSKYAAILSHMLDRSFFDDDQKCMMIVINSYIKKKIVEKVELKNAGAINTAINQALEIGLLLPVENGVYLFNKEYFGSRNWAEVQEIMIAQIYDNKGFTVLRSINYGDADGDIPLGNLDKKEDVDSYNETSSTEMDEKKTASLRTVTSMETGEYKENETDRITLEQTTLPDPDQEEDNDFFSKTEGDDANLFIDFPDVPTYQMDAELPDYDDMDEAISPIEKEYRQIR